MQAAKAALGANLDLLAARIRACKEDFACDPPQLQAVACDAPQLKDKPKPPQCPVYKMVVDAQQCGSYQECDFNHPDHYDRAERMCVKYPKTCKVQVGVKDC
jgi:hypothetical protein